MRCNLAVYRLMHAETIPPPSRRMNRRQCSEALPLRHGRLAPRLTPAIEEATMSRLQNKVAVITGGTSGIGLAAAQRFVAEETAASSPAANCRSTAACAPSESAQAIGSSALPPAGA